MGDRVDMRVVTNIESTEGDISTGEFANGPLDSGKVVLDSIINSKYTSKREARRVIIPSFQATELDGELKMMKLVAPGLYTVQYVGSVLIPNQVADLKQLREKCLPRLDYMKNQAKVLAESVKKDTRAKRRKSSAYQRPPSHDSDDEADMR